MLNANGDGHKILYSMCIHWEPRVAIKPMLSSLASPEVVITTTSGTASDDKISFTKAPAFKCQPRSRGLRAEKDGPPVSERLLETHEMSISVFAKHRGPRWLVYMGDTCIPLDGSIISTNHNHWLWLLEITQVLYLNPHSALRGLWGPVQWFWKQISCINKFIGSVFHVIPLNAAKHIHK